MYIIVQYILFGLHYWLAKFIIYKDACGLMVIYNITRQQ